ncbi:hypothetical protein [Streptomyces jumonjinensis]|uniref:hypothetical protein n=1 Tax=Streptomyces jumonjinensis TaxID=1945 RepID=UPI0037951309
MGTNNTVYVDSDKPDDLRRRHLYDGQIFLFTPTATTTALCDFAAQLIEDAFAPLAPATAQFEMPVERFVEIFAPLKPRYMHHPETRRLLRQVFADFGCDPEQTFFDVPKLRGVTSNDYLTAGVGYAHPPHRDTWWSAPLAQLNWWMPIYGIESENSFAFHPRSWSEGMKNHSEDFNYYEWNAVGRAQAARHTHTDNRKQPHPPANFDPEPQLRFVVPRGGLVVFSSAQLHSTVRNTSGRTRFSTDFRTVNLADLRAGLGAPNIDSQPQGTSLRDFHRASDSSVIPEEVVAAYDHGEHPEGGVLVFAPPSGPSA